MRDNSHSTGYILAYTYDHNANRLTKVVGTGGGAVTTTNTYGTHDQLLTSGSKSYGYDSNGNCTSVTVGTSVTSISYDYENRVVGITYPSTATNSFAYNGNDLRMQKVDSAGTANYLCDGTTPASAVLKDGSAVYTPGLSERRGTTSKFYHGDALGSTRGITNSSQAVTDSVLYDGFGMTVSRTGTTPTPFGFVGKGQYQTDNDSGLMLLGHRYYDASVGRFISSDPAKAGDNWYAYCDNNPLADTDEVGLDGKKGKGRPKIDPNRGHGPQGTGQSGNDRHTEPRAGDKGNQGFGQDAINRPLPSSPGRRGASPPSARAQRQQEIDRQNAANKNKGSDPYNYYDPNSGRVYYDPTSGAIPIDLSSIDSRTGCIVLIGFALVGAVATGNEELVPPLLGAGKALLPVR